MSIFAKNKNHQIIVEENFNSIINQNHKNTVFNNFSHFNKLFKEFTGKSASKYRGELKLMVQ